MTAIMVMPAGIHFEARMGQTLMEEAQRAGLYWPTTCGGQGICTTCLSEVISGQENLAEMGRGERKRLVAERGEAFLTRLMRLACQAGVIGNGPITVSKVGVRQTDAEAIS